MKLVIKVIFAAVLLSTLWIALRPLNDAMIYAKVIEKLITEDDTYGGSLSPKKIFISKKLLTLENMLTENGNSGQLERGIIQSINEILSARKIELTWIQSPHSLVYNEVGEIQGGGVLIVLEPIESHFFTANTTGSIRIATEASGGTNYRFYRWLDGWRLWSTELAWIS